MATTPVKQRSAIAAFLVGAIGGAVVGWFAHRGFVVPTGMSSGSAARSDVGAQANEAAASANSPAMANSSAQSPKVESRIAASPRGGESPLHGAAQPSSPAVLIASESSQPAASSTQPPTLNDLLDSANIRCTFGPGNGGSWPQGKLTVGDAAWQGGPVDFQSIDYAGGSAQMLGNVARSREGQVPVKVSTSSSGVSFTGVSGNGTLTVITMFARFDSAGHHAAVLSMHDGQQDLDTAQFYGACDSTQKRLN